MQLNHIGISTPDIERSLCFYRDLLGLTVMSDSLFLPNNLDLITGLINTKGRVVVVGNDSFKLEIFEFSSPNAQKMDINRPVCDHGITHICLEVKDLDADYKRLKKKGVKFHCPPQQFSRAKATYGRDPDGNIVELLQLRID